MQQHIPVLADEVVAVAKRTACTTVLDATVGTGGHTELLLRAMERGVLVGIDLDTSALQEALQRLEKQKKDAVDVMLLEGNFREVATLSAQLSIAAYDVILADLGWGSHQLQSGKGLSFLHDEVLDMCYGAPGTCSVTALEIVNTFEQEALRELLVTYGDERWAKRIAAHIVAARATAPITTSGMLADIVSGAIPRALQGTLHPATKTFQALRIAVNDEVGALREFLAAVPALLRPNGYLAVITFHSLEDRVVKHTFKEWEQHGVGQRGVKKGIRPTEEEKTRNPRSRSALLRTFTVTT